MSLASNEHQPAAKGFSWGAFFLGLALVALIYGLLSGWLWMSREATMAAKQARLASQTVIVERPPPPLPPEKFGPFQSEAPPADAVIPQEPVAVPDEAAAIAVPAVVAVPPAEETPVSDGGLAATPKEGLFELTPEGRLPVKGADGLTPFEAYRRPFQAVPGQPFISVAVIDMGLSGSASEAAVTTLPPEISLGISPYADDPELWAMEARAQGHEIWLMLPVENPGYPQQDTGPHTLLVGVPERQNQARLSWIMGRATGYAGLITSEQPVLMESLNDMRPVLGAIFSRGLGLINTATTPDTAQESMADGMKAAYARADVWIDARTDKESIDAAFAQLEAIAKQKGHAVGLMRPLPVSYQGLTRWHKTLPEKNLTLAPLSAAAAPKAP